MDNKQKTGIAHRSRINIHESYEVDYWANKYGISKDKLKAVVQTVGTAVAKVEAYLKK